MRTNIIPGRAYTKWFPEVPYDPKNEPMSMSTLSPKKSQINPDPSSLPLGFTRLTRTALCPHLGHRFGSSITILRLIYNKENTKDVLFPLLRSVITIILNQRESYYKLSTLEIMVSQKSLHGCFLRACGALTKKARKRAKSGEKATFRSPALEIADEGSITYGHNAGQRFTARQIARARPTGPERPNKMSYRELPAKVIVARSRDPTRKSAAVLPSQSVALTRAGEAIFPPEKPGIMRGEMPQINNVMKPTARL
jgi:hypothetical protein